MVESLSSSWKTILQVQSSDPDEAWREYIFRVLLVMMGVTLSGFLLLISVGWIVGIFEPYSVGIMLALNVFLGLSYWMVGQGRWRRARIIPIAIFYLMGVYGSAANGIATNLNIFYVLVIFLTAVLFDRQMQLRMLLLCLIAPVAMELIFDPLEIIQHDDLESMLSSTITLAGLLIGISLLVGFVVERMQAALQKANAYAQELSSEMKERQQAVQALAESEAKYRNIIESIPIGMHMYRLEEDGRLVFSGSNPTADEILGVDNSQFIGKTIEEAFPALVETQIPEMYRWVASDGIGWETEQIDYEDDKIVGAFEVHAFQNSPGRMVAAFLDVTERKQALETQERLVAIMEATSDVVSTANINKKIQYINLSGRQLLRVDENEDVSSISWGMFYPSNSKSIIENEAIPTAIKEGVWSGELEMVSRDGKVIPVSQVIIAHTDVNGDLRYLSTIARDIGERVKAEQELKFRVDFERLLTTISARFINIRTEYLEGELQRALKEVGDFTAVDRTYVFKFSADLTCMDCVYEWTASEVPAYKETLQNIETANYSWWLEKMKSGETFSASSLGEIPAEGSKIVEKLSSISTKSLINVPIFQKGALIGFFGLATTRTERAWSQENISLIRLVADIIANALERQTMEYAIQVSEDRYRTLFNHAGDAIIVSDQHGQILDANNLTCERLGYQRRDLVGMRIADINAEGESEFASEFVNGVRDNGNRLFETAHVAKDGSTIPVELNATMIDYNGEPSILGIARDITERKQHELEQEAIVTLSTALRKANNRDEMLPIILEEVIKVSGATGASLVMIDYDQGDMVIELGSGVSEAHTGTRIPSGSGISGIVVETEQPYVTNDLPNDPRLVHLHPGDVPTSAAVIPLSAKGKVIGVMWVVRNIIFTRGDVRLLTALGEITANAIQRATLFDELEQSNRELEIAYDTTLEGWAKALELRDKETEGHSRKVTKLTVKLASRAGIESDDLVHVRRGALLHDIGKMGIPDEILQKPGPLSEDEWEIMRKHPLYAYELLIKIPYLQPALDIPYYHHEKWDGSGYPYGLRGEEIPLAARIFAIVDVWDALCSDRPYRKAWVCRQALEYIQGQAGKHFDPRLVTEFLKLIEDDHSIYEDTPH